jgi:predicted XRE-type DNA-binding protein
MYQFFHLVTRVRPDQCLRPCPSENRPSFAKVGLELADAEERQTKVRLTLAINQILDQRRLRQAEAARQLGINQPKISALSNYRLAGFSVERLMHFLNALGRDVEIVIRSKPRSRRTARTFVTAA